ncbi:hypothetical protein EVAR_5239_1 [Eumeta japonica]|uniref:Uncharacterized protein n=1 Tax=Eumeta variegata TaxID=151549 RepID=A0A4C1XPW3_EUMVA|nr:hypothetical protein EVAR_5239_1 [Eumeta japonica]
MRFLLRGLRINSLILNINSNLGLVLNFYSATGHGANLDEAEESPTSDGGAERGPPGAEKAACGTYRAPAHHAPKLPPDPPEVYEISPYATFAGPGAAAGGARAYTLQLRALARHDDDAAPPHNTPCCEEETCVDALDVQRRRRRRRHYCPDHDLELKYPVLSQCGLRHRLDAINDCDQYDDDQRSTRPDSLSTTESLARIEGSEGKLRELFKAHSSSFIARRSSAL